MFINSEFVVVTGQLVMNVSWKKYKVELVYLSMCVYIYVCVCVCAR